MCSSSWRRLLWLPVLFVLALTVACAEGPGFNPSPSAEATATQPLVGDGRNSCTSAAPGSFKVSGGEAVNDGFKNQFSWEPAASSNAPGYLTTYQVEVYRREVGNRPYAVMTLSGTVNGDGRITVTRHDFPKGIYSARIRSYCGDVPAGLWSAVVEFSNGEGSLNGPPDPPAPPPPCVPTIKKKKCPQY